MLEDDSKCTPGLSADKIGKNEEWLRLIEENVRDYAIFLIDTNGCISSWNLGAERILGFGEQDILGRPGKIIFTPEDRKKKEPERELETARREGRAEDERWHLRKDGSRFWGNGILTALRDTEGSLHGYVKILRDFTDRKQAEEAANRHQSEIESLNLRLKRTMSETHHRVKNNLQVITALLDMKIMDGNDVVPISEFKRLRLHIRALASIHELLTHAVKTDSEVSEISSGAMINQLGPMLLTSVGRRPIEFDVADIALPTRYGSSLAILVNELVTNAVKHGGGKITVSLKVQGNSVHLIVQDEGPGFAAGFSPRTHAHTGVDLIESLSRWDLKGTIEYCNRPAEEGGGARVVVVFPQPTADDWNV
jgi:PAS domain S-box-containing protein